MPDYLLVDINGTRSVFKYKWVANNNNNNKSYTEAYWLSSLGWVSMQTAMPTWSYATLQHMGAIELPKEELALILLDKGVIPCYT